MRRPWSTPPTTRHSSGGGRRGKSTRARTGFRHFRRRPRSARHESRARPRRRDAVAPRLPDVRGDGEHDYYLDLGEYWSELFGDQYYSFDHKGVHSVVLNSVLTYDEWMFERWETPERRMNEMAGLDNPNGSPFMVGERQREWLRNDLANIPRTTPIVVLSHSPLQKIYKGWNFWTEDAEDVQAILAPFGKVNVIYGHVHQIQYNQIGSIAFNSVMASSSDVSRRCGRW